VLGSNDHGQLGNEAVGSQSSVPVPVVGASPKSPVVVPPKPAPVVPKPLVVVKPKPVAPQILVASLTRTISRTRTATIATLVCPSGWAGGSCKVTAGKTVNVLIGRKLFTVAVTAPKSVRAGRRVNVTVKLSRKAAKRLRGKTATVRTTIRLGSTTKTVSQKITAPMPKPASKPGKRKRR
jgi:hypothetical protein